MTAAFSARRRADEFEALLSREADSLLTDRDAQKYADLLGVVSDLRSLPEVTARPEFVGSLRERLMAEADTALVRQPPAPQRLAMPATTRRRDRRLGALLGGVAMVGATATMAVAAQTSLPGESLYGVKRGIEAAQVRLADDESQRGRTLLAQADKRLTELEQLAAGDGGGEQLVPDTLDAFTEQSSTGVRSLLTSYDRGVEQDAQRARDFTATSLERLDALEEQLPESARDELLAAGRTLTDLDLEVSSACPVCTGGITATPDFLLTSAPVDLLTGLDVDELTLEAAPVSGQDLTGIVVPEELKALPTAVPTSTALPTAVPTPATTSLPDPTKTDPTTTEPGKPIKDLTDGVTGTTGNLVDEVDEITGGAIGGLTSEVDDATGGLIGEITGTLDPLTGNTLGNATGGLLP
ncbi:hypothetical protein CFI00_03120 [Nocardioides sp. S5]|uniref:DUF5667 domain-containing protein n=1 Tax=Nocardioides sp. S5 TaxID=2017486 RepID=UPI001A8ECC49|nr:DUF5667 domain-containing protein [Nocardioides sp. S5]QSR29512.1 hypothetical protein CFI00_03120 [Nocardioides sp. S5]